MERTVSTRAGVGRPAAVMWLWVAIIGDYVAWSAAKWWRFRSGRWKHIRV